MGNWDEVVWRLRVKILNGRVHLNFHSGDGQRYLISFGSDSTQLIKPGITPKFFYERLGRHTPDQWHVVEIGLVRGFLRVHVDGVEEIVVFDDDPLRGGGIWLESLDNSTVRFDDIHICKPIS